MANKYSPPLARLNTPSTPKRGTEFLPHSLDINNVAPNHGVKGQAALTESIMEEFVRTLKELSAVQLMDKKDSIERDIREFTDVLQTVRQRRGGREPWLLFCAVHACSKVQWAWMVCWWTGMATPGATSMSMLYAQLETRSYVSLCDYSR